MEQEEQAPRTDDAYARLERKLDAVYASVEKTRKYFTIILWVTVAMIVLPAIGLAVVIPTFINTYLGAFDGLL